MYFLIQYNYFQRSIYQQNRTFRVSIELRQFLKRYKNRTYEHSGIDETHISFETSCLLQLNIAAFSGIRYDLVRILKPLPQVTEHDDHGE